MCLAKSNVCIIKKKKKRNRATSLIVYNIICKGFSGCKHSQCTKLCHEACDREPCLFPCNKKLKCKHKCIGLCGDPCPKLCRKCNYEQVSEIFFGNEDDPQARFVYLEECGHVIEATGMDNWMRSRYGEEALKNEQSGNNSVQLPECPKCRTPIRTNMRYAKYVKKQLQLIERIKMKQFGDAATNKTQQKSLLRNLIKFAPFEETSKFVELDEFFPARLQKSLFKCIYEKLNNDPLSFNQLAALENTLNISLKLNKVNESIKRLFRSLGKNPAIDHLTYELAKLNSLIFDADTNRLFSPCGQRLDELMCETERLESLLAYYECRQCFEASLTSFSQKKREEIEQILSEIDVNLSDCVEKFDRKKRTSIQELFAALKRHGITTVHISEEEKLMVVKAMELKKGHW